MAEQKKILGSDVQLYYKKSVWEDKKNKIKNKFKFNWEIAKDIDWKR